jgi:hypothetical protein
MEVVMAYFKVMWVEVVMACFKVLWMEAVIACFKMISEYFVQKRTKLQISQSG